MMSSAIFDEERQRISSAREDSNRFNYVYSCDLDSYFEIKIMILEGLSNSLVDSLNKISKDLYVTAQLHHNGRPLSLPMQTAYKAHTNHWSWNEWLVLPLKYLYLPRNCMLAINIWKMDSNGDPEILGGTSVSIFSRHGCLRKGIHELKVWEGVQADGCFKTATPGSKIGVDSELDTMKKLMKQHAKGDMISVDWLDRITFRELELMAQKEKANSKLLTIHIEFPRVYLGSTEHTVIYFEKGAKHADISYTTPSVVKIPDPMILQENIIEAKHHRLVRSARTGTIIPDMKPNAELRDQLRAIVAYPPTQQLTSEEKDLIWRFRHYLSNQKKALTKFVKSVSWSMSAEAKQAAELMSKWEPVDAADALELLTPQFTCRTVRQYAVSRLVHASNDEILRYLPQLVQALKYEPPPERISSELKPDSSSLDEPENITIQSIMAPGADDEDAKEEEDPSRVSRTKELSETTMSTQGSSQDLATFLIERAASSDQLSNFFYWHLLVECGDKRDKKRIQMYHGIMRRFSLALSTMSSESCHRRRRLRRMQEFLDNLSNVSKVISQLNGNKKKKTEKLRQLLEGPGFVFNEPLCLPLSPDIKIRHIYPEKATIFKSLRMPIKLTFKTTTNKDMSIIFKNGDDLRQDQLVLQIISVMNMLLLSEHLDLKLIPYLVLATNENQGLVQFIESETVAEILSRDGSIQNFFRKHAYSQSDPFEISSEIMDNYIRSCAGYCVITHILGVGDRHFDNLLLTKTGRLFHVDFGYILGRDPKPFPPPMKLSREMVEAMGGTTSEYYQQFRELCFTAFLCLRQHSGVILNLFSLMLDASVTDIALEPDKTVQKVMEKFLPDRSDEQAIQYMQSLIEDSVNAVLPLVVEQIHKWAQYWRR